MKKITKSIMLTLAMVLSLGLAVSVTAEAKGSVSSVAITAPTKKSSTTITLKDEPVTKQMKVTVKVKGGASKEVSYKSSNSKVVSVSKTGLLTAKKKGTATITVTSTANKKKKDTLKITVKQLPTKVSAKVEKPVGSYSDVYSLTTGKTYKLSAKVSPSSANDKKVTYSSSNKKVAKIVISKGVAKVKAGKAGSATITVKAKANSKAVAKIKIVVAKKITKKVKTVSVTAEATALKTGETTKVTATVTPSNATLKTVAFKSSNTKVVTVDSKTGAVQAVGAGEATITAQAIDGSKKKASVKITVIDPKTIVTPNAKVTATAVVEFTKAADLQKDIDEYIKLAKIPNGTKLAVVIDGKDKVAEVKDGTVVIGSKTIADLTTTKVTVKATVNAQKYFAALTFTPASVTKVTVDKAEFTNITDKSFTLNGVDYTYTVDGKTIVIDGDHVETIKGLLSAYADVAAN